MLAGSSKALFTFICRQRTYKLTYSCFWLVEQYQCVIWFDKMRFREKSYKMTGKIPLLLQILGLTYLELLGQDLPFILSSGLTPSHFLYIFSILFAVSLNEWNPTELGLRSARLFRIKMKFLRPVLHQLKKNFAQYN